MHRTILIISTIVSSWLGMQAVHELGHVLGALLSGGRVAQVVLNPLTISRTDLSYNPHPLVTVWSGPIFGALLPLTLWGLVQTFKFREAFLLRFFAGFCLVANGVYIGAGSFDRIGDCGEMLRHGSQPWQLWLFGLATTPFGIWLWHRQGPHFGFGEARGNIDKRACYVSVAACAFFLVLGVVIGGN
jgi:hypothetical protein